MHRVLLVSILLLAGCDSISGPTSSFSREATVPVGRTVSIVEDVAVRFVEVTGDSRCPADALCIQGGDAIVKLRVMVDGRQRDVELHTGNTRPVSSQGLTIELLQLMPYPFSSRPIQPDDYEATIRVTR
jgi:hypothetical protein